MHKRFEEDRYYRPDDPELDTIASRGTLATWRWQGRGPRYTKYGNRVLYRGGDLNAWLDSRVVDPAGRAHEEPRGGGGHSLADVDRSRNPAPAFLRCAGCGASVPWWRRLCETCALWMRAYSGHRKASRALSKLDRSGS